MNGNFEQSGHLGMRTALAAFAPLTEDRLRGHTLDLWPLRARASIRFYHPWANRRVKGCTSGGASRLPPCRPPAAPREGGMAR